MFRNNLRKTLAATVLTGLLAFTAAPAFAGGSDDGSDPSLLDAFFSAVSSAFWGGDDSAAIDPDGAH